MKKIPLTQGYEAIVDDEDFAEVSKYKWYASYTKHNKRWDVRNHPCGKLSRFLMKPNSDELVDHKNHNTFDHRRCNLRVCTKTENGRNRKIQFNKTGYKGVTRCYGVKKYACRARIHPAGKTFVGTFRHHAVLAAKDYDDLAKKYFGEFAFVNFPCSIRRERYSVALALKNI
jgi:hypothetical protein